MSARAPLKRYALICARIVFWLCVIYVAVAVVLVINQRDALYHPTPHPFSDCELLSGVTPITRESGARFYFNHASPERVVILYFGNGANACEQAGPLSDFFRYMNISSIAVEYAGYGGDPRGTPREDRILSDTRDIIQYVSEKGFEEITIVGVSLGASVATYHATIAPPDHLILITPFLSVPELASDLYPYPPFLTRLLLLDHFPTKEWIRSVEEETALTIIHGTKDALIPLAHGKEIFSIAPQKNKKFVALEGAEHNTIIAFPLFWETLENIHTEKNW